MSSGWIFKLTSDSQWQNSPTCAPTQTYSNYSKVSKFLKHPRRTSKVQGPHSFWHHRNLYRRCSWWRKKTHPPCRDFIDSWYSVPQIGRIAGCLVKLNMKILHVHTCLQISMFMIYAVHACLQSDSHSDVFMFCVHLIISHTYNTYTPTLSVAVKCCIQVLKINPKPSCHWSFHGHFARYILADLEFLLLVAECIHVPIHSPKMHVIVKCDVLADDEHDKITWTNQSFGISNVWLAGNSHHR